METGNETTRWYALQVRGRREKAVANMLRGQGYEPLLPLYSDRRRWSDRVKQLDLPLFPGYLFCLLNERNRGSAVFTPGVVRIVGTAGNPIPIDDAEIAAVHRVAESGIPSRRWPFLEAGRKVTIEEGPLCGLEGVVVRSEEKHRFVVSVSLLQRSVAVEIEPDWVNLVN